MSKTQVCADKLRNRTVLPSVQ